jgi:hypothetical protein
MALTVARKYESPTTHWTGTTKWEPLTGKLVVVRTYDATDVAENVLAALTANFSTINVAVDSTTIACGLAEISVQTLSSARSLITATWEGYALGIMYWNSRGQGESERLMVSLDNPPQQFGPNNEGAIVIMPLTVYTVVGHELTSNVDGTQGIRAIANTLVGACNENGWYPDFLSSAQGAGYWLLSAAEFTPNRDMLTYTYQYTFEKKLVVFNGTTYPMSQYPWGFLQSAAATGGQNLLYTLSGSVYTPQRYPLAGQATLAAYEFEDLFLDN